MSEAPTRRDATRNRKRLVSAAADVFRARGPDVPLEEIAGAAGVSRTTLHRHFADREALAAAVLEENVCRIEARAAALTDVDDGAEQLYHYLLDVQLEAPWLARTVAGEDVLGLSDLADRTAAALEPLMTRARAAGVLRPSVTTQDVLLTLPMAMAVQPVATPSGRGGRTARCRAILHFGLFTTEPPPSRVPDTP
ncbi:TetR/AcrR family transcriptional regulator [Pseudonocardia parietis]|uniref:AcrR family transcriptional regulator n=1 Tax=Pseudonocardia parietis TaxID=570936 RepID=A0ABS4W345_9PSEU|nr:TetR/AcrR family transcriptional regulator [Pseudonocardia parietis]MBP2370436.1 AcrR family transcriptional regulator [Pseudonocardia parietis]